MINTKLQMHLIWFFTNNFADAGLDYFQKATGGERENTGETGRRKQYILGR